MSISLKVRLEKHNQFILTADIFTQNKAKKEETQVVGERDHL